jgi:periplasmic protein TonB
MSADQLPPRNEAGRAAAALRSYQDEPGLSGGELIRLFVVPALVAVVFVGGVYWIRLRLPAGSVGQPSTSVVQVHLLPRPDAAPIAVASVSHPVMENVASRADASLEEPEPTISDDPAPKPKPFSPADAPPSNVMSAPSAMSGPANDAAAKFQQALLRHVAQYQHYPSGRYAILDGQGRYASRRLGENEFGAGRARQGGDRDHPPVATAAADSAGIAGTS